jgi:hypothetical protein
MKPDGMLVGPEHATVAFEDVARSSGEDALNALAATELALAGFITQQLAAVAGRPALSRAPTPVVSGVHGEVLSTVLTAVQALRRGHYHLWRDTMTGTRLAQLDNQFQPPKRRRRKKGPDAEAVG